MAPVSTALDFISPAFLFPTVSESEWIVQVQTIWQEVSVSIPPQGLIGKSVFGAISQEFEHDLTLLCYFGIETTGRCHLKEKPGYMILYRTQGLDERFDEWIICYSNMPLYLHDRTDWLPMTPKTTHMTVTLWESHDEMLRHVHYVMSHM